MDKQYENTAEAYTEEFTKWTVEENLALRKRIAELEAVLKECVDSLETWVDDLYARGSVPPGYRDIYEKALRQLLNGEK
jgi:hypothetical protein